MTIAVRRNFIGFGCVGNIADNAELMALHCPTRDVLTNPLIRAVDRHTASIMLTEIRTRRLFNVPECFFHEGNFKKFLPVFTMIADKLQAYYRI